MIRFLVFFLFIICSSGWCQGISPAKEGKLDLRGWDPNKTPVISLDGEWEFYWNSLLLSKDIKENSRTTFAQLSIPWNEQLIGNQYLPKNGYATYALRIILPKDMDSVAFAVPAVFNCYAFWVNDQLICSSGKVATRADEMVPLWRPQTVSVATPGDTLQVIFQISNFQQTRGGCAEVMRIGDMEYLTSLDSTFHISGFGLIIFFGLTSLLGFSIYFILRSTSFLYIALLALAFTIRFLFSDLYFYYDLGIRLSWEVVAKIEYFTIPVIVLFGALFINNIYPQEFKRSILHFFLAANTLMMVIVIFSPSSFFSPLLVVIQVLGLVFVLYTMYVIIRALIFQRAGAWVSTLGIGVFAMVGFYNIYTFIMVSDMNRTVIHSGYALALLLNVISLLYRNQERLRSEEQDILRFSDFYNDQGKSII